MSYDYYYYDTYDYFDYIWASGVATVWMIICLALAAVCIVAMWKLYLKAGEEGWAAIIPFYDSYVLYKITWGNGWYFLLLMIPFANVVIEIITLVKLAKAFGKGGGWACGLIFLYPIFLMIMAFSNDIKYVGVPGKEQWDAPPPGGYGGSGGGYQDPYQRAYQDSYRQEPEQGQYRQESSQNPNYHYQRNEPQGSPGGYCPDCGTKVEAGTKFCPSCGKRL